MSNKLVDILKEEIHKDFEKFEKLWKLSKTTKISSSLVKSIDSDFLIKKITTTTSNKNISKIYHNDERTEITGVKRSWIVQTWDKFEFNLIVNLIRENKVLEIEKKRRDQIKTVASYKRDNYRKYLTLPDYKYQIVGKLIYDESNQMKHFQEFYINEFIMDRVKNTPIL